MNSTPARVRMAARLVRALPFGRYRLLRHLRKLASSPFTAALPPELGGARFHCDLHDEMAAEVCFTGRYEPQETQLAARLLREGDAFVDVGANWGYFTLAAAHWVGRHGRIVALEPEPRLFALLSANVATNDLPQVHAIHGAAAAEPGMRAFQAYRADEGNWGVSRSVSGPCADFLSRAVRLDDLLDEVAVARVRLVKIDVEGDEGSVLEGMRRGLGDGRYAYVMLELHPAHLADRHVGIERCLAPLLDTGYRLWRIRQSPAVYRRAARVDVPVSELLEPCTVAAAASGSWPHVLAAARAEPDPA